MQAPDGGHSEGGASAELAAAPLPQRKDTGYAMLGPAAAAAGATGAARAASRLGARGGPRSKPYGAADASGGAASARNPFLQASLPEGAPQPYHMTSSCNIQAHQPTLGQPDLAPEQLACHSRHMEATVCLLKPWAALGAVDEDDADEAPEAFPPAASVAVPRQDIGSRRLQVKPASVIALMNGALSH